MRDFYYSERHRHVALIEKSFFGQDRGNGFFKGERYGFVLCDGLNNLYEPIRRDALRYFEDNGVSWWGGKKPTGHVLSSQIACLNHLMLIRKEPEAVLALINGVRNQFKAVLPIASDSDTSYIAFEAVSDTDYLNEDGPTRGSNCTSVDALIVAMDGNNEKWLIPIEWKYTESYPDYPSCDKSAGSKGIIRMSRYNYLIDASAQLRSLQDYKGSIYYYEPFYQLMRQTLWAEQMIANKAKERVKADHFLHIHVIPSANNDLLHWKYRAYGKGMEDTWRSMIVDQSRYVIIDPEDFLSPVKSAYPDLWRYLSERYYNKTAAC